MRSEKNIVPGHVIGRYEIPDQIRGHENRKEKEKSTRKDALECGMAGQPDSGLLDEPREVGEHGLRTHPPAPDAAVEDREQHNAGEKQEKQEQIEVRLADPDHGTEEVQLERGNVEPQRALALNADERQREQDQRLNPGCDPTPGSKSLYIHENKNPLLPGFPAKTTKDREGRDTGNFLAFVLMLVLTMEVKRYIIYLRGAELFLVPRHALRRSLADNFDMVID